VKLLPIENKLNMQKRPMKYNIFHFRSIESIKQEILPSFKEKGFDKKTKKKHIILFFEIWDI
jgi:hypothetical protein